MKTRIFVYITKDGESHYFPQYQTWYLGVVPVWESLHTIAKSVLPGVVKNKFVVYETDFGKFGFPDYSRPIGLGFLELDDAKIYVHRVLRQLEDQPEKQKSYVIKYPK